MLFFSVHLLESWLIGNHPTSSLSLIFLHLCTNKVLTSLNAMEMIKMSNGDNKIVHILDTYKGIL